MKASKRTKEDRLSSCTPSPSNSAPLLEKLETRILLSGDSLLDPALPESLSDTTSQIVQHAEWFKISDEQQRKSTEVQDILHYIDPTNSEEIDSLEPILTLSIEDGDSHQDTELEEIVIDEVDESVEILNDPNPSEVCLAQLEADPAVHSKNFYRSTPNVISSAQVVHMAVENPEKSVVALVEDSNIPEYTTDAEIDVEYATSIEIRGPPIESGELIKSLNSEVYIQSGEFAELSDMECSHQLKAPDLPGLQLKNPDISSWQGQIFYLNFNGQDDLTYNGPVTVEGISVPGFVAPGDLAGLEHAIITEVLGYLEHYFENSGIIFTTERPSDNQFYSTIYIGGDDSAFSIYGSFLGLAEKVDSGNQDRNDFALVFTEEILSDQYDFNQAIQALVSVISHEAGHLLGYAHQNEVLYGALSGVASEVNEESDQYSYKSMDLYGVSQALFVENQGQWPESTIRYLHDGNSVDVAATNSRLIFKLSAYESENILPLQFSTFFVGANEILPIGLEPSESILNYYIGNPSNWRQGVPSYRKVAYEDLYEGIDMHISGLRSHLKYEFHVMPGADWSQIVIRYEGIDGLSIAEDGSLAVDLGSDWGVIYDEAPYIYQEIGGEEISVAGQFNLLDDQTCSFEITGDVDPNYVLVVDPDLAWSTYLGGGNSDEGNDIAVDTSGNAYVTGITDSAEWTVGGFDTTFNGAWDVFVTKLGSDGSHLWSTYLGGSHEDEGCGIALDPSGDVYVAGSTASSDWTLGGFDTTFNGERDVFVAKLNSDGIHQWSTYLGGSYGDQGYGIASDASGDVYVTGSTASTGWTSGGFDTTFNGVRDAFVVKLGSEGAFVWSSYLGGSQEDEGRDIAFDSSGNVYIAGSTASSGWTSLGSDTTFGGEWDAFAVSLSSDGEHLWSKYLGGDLADYGYGIVVDTTNYDYVYVTGTTSSSGWTRSGFDTTYKDGRDVFVAQISQVGHQYWSTYLGGSLDDEGRGITIDTWGNLYVTGCTDSPDWIVGGFDTIFNGERDAFVTRLSIDGPHLWSTYLGASGSDEGRSIAVDVSGGIYVTGGTDSTGWASGDFDTTYNGGGADAFIAKLTDIEITVLGNNIPIADGDTTPSIDDWTDFGTTPAGGTPLSRSFRIRNDGNSILTLGPVTLPEGFSMSGSFQESLIPGARDSIHVKLESTTVGVWSGDISFTNNDLDENPFNFRITATIARPEEPEVTVLGNGETIRNGDRSPSLEDHTDFGEGVYDGATPISRTFTVINQGISTLELGPVIVPEGFTLIESLSSSLTMGESDTFTIQMETNGPGTMNGMVSFSTNDPDENPYEFRIEGKIISAPQPSVTIIGNGVVIGDGNARPSVNNDTDFGVVFLDELPVSHTFTIRNDGGSLLQVGTPEIPTGFVLVEGLSTKLLAGESDTFTIQMDTSIPGARSGDVFIPNNDTGDYPFQFRIMGRVLSPSEFPPTEVFDWPSEILDLANSATVLTPLGSSYTVLTRPISVLPTNPTGGMSLELGDNDSALVNLPSDRTTSLYGQSYSSFYVGSNGYITFTEPDSDSQETLEDHFDTPRISVLFNNLDPSESGTVTWRLLSDRAVVTWEGVPDTMQVEMYFDGRIQLAWLTMNSSDGIVGLSDGLGVPDGFVETDFSRAGVIAPDIRVLGNGIPISNGSETTTEVDNTDFGRVSRGGTPVSRTFMVRNDGSETLSVRVGTLPTGFQLVEELSRELTMGESDTFTVQMDTTTRGTKSGDISISSNDGDKSPFVFRITGTVALVFGPDIEVLGNNVTIVDGDDSPGTADGTDFGAFLQGTSEVSRIFTIRNNGTDTLTFGDVTVPDGYTLTEGPSSSLAAGASDAFTVRLDEATAGIKSGVISIATNDSDESPFNFRITGHVMTAGPEIRVHCGVTINDGDTTPRRYDSTDFGCAGQGGHGVRRTYQVFNDGTETLTLGSIGVPEGFIMTEGLSESIAPGEYDLFTVWMYASTVGTWTGDISFVTNDSDENPFNFRITGEVFERVGPEITVLSQEAGLAVISDDDMFPSLYLNTDFGSVVQGGDPISWSFRVQNTGWETLLLGPVNLPEGFTLTEGLSESLAAGATDRFTVQLDSETIGTKSGDISFSTNDPDENSFNFRIRGTVVSADTPEITVMGHGALIEDGDANPNPADWTDFGYVAQDGSAIERTFTVRNDGPVDLTLGEITVPTGFTLMEGLSPSLKMGEWDTFTVQLNTATTGIKSGDISFSTNDSDENPFNFRITGHVASGLPEITVVGNGISIANKDTIPSLTDWTDFGSVMQDDDAIERTFTVRNDGSIDLTLGEITVPSGFTLIEGLSPSLEMGEWDTFTVQLNTATPGTKSGDISFSTNDSDENPFSFRITGTVISTGVPEIEILGNGVPIVDGDTLPDQRDDTDFGTVNMNDDSVTHTFTIINDGSADLTMTGNPDRVIVTGSDDFTVTQQPAFSVSPGGTTTFEVTFDPSSEGIQTATISIANNDADENPYDFVIRGEVLGGLFGVEQIINNQVAGISSTYACDLDGDGDNDVLTASHSEDKISWFENLGGNAFGPRQNISTQAEQATSVYACDLDGDGDNDVLSASSGDEKIAWYENMGGGVFSSERILDTRAFNATSVYACDLDGDGDNDVLSALSYNGRITWYENLGAGTFGSQQIVGIRAGGANSVYACDLDGDGDYDVLTAYDSSIYSNVAWYENLGNGTFGDQQVISARTSDGRSVYAADLDDDGDNDVLSACGHGIYWYENIDEGGFGSQQLISSEMLDAWSVYACDLDGDGDHDVLSGANSGNSLAWYENLGGGVFGSQQIISAEVDGARSVYACDLDGDGDHDVITISHYEAKVMWFENFRYIGGGSPEIDIELNETDDVHSHSFGSVENGQSVAREFTVRNEGNAALIVTQVADLISSFRINPTNDSSSTDDWLIPAGGIKTFTVTFSPLDSGNHSDTLVLTNNDSDESSYQIILTGTVGGPEIEVLGNGQVIVDGDTTPNPNKHTDFGILSVPNGSVTWTFTIENPGLEDLNLSGSPDRVIITGSSDFTVTRQPDSVIAAGGSTTFEITFDPSRAETHTAIINIASDDYNENLYDFMIQGLGILFGSQQVISTQADLASSVFACDLDGDGDNDVLSASAMDDKIAWYENLGGGNFSSQIIITTQADGAESVYACDIDGDGDNDVISASENDNKIAWYENQGGGTFGDQQVISTQLHMPRSVHACDLDGDGDNDILASDFDGMVVWYKNLGGFFKENDSQIISTRTGAARSVYACDLDGDGDNDVLTAYDFEIIWFANMGDGTFSSEQSISTQVGYAGEVFACDLDGDGDNDVLSTSYNVAWYENLGGSVFGDQQIINGDQMDGPNSLYACDLDGDGDNDVLMTHWDEDIVTWCENLGGGTFGNQQIISTQTRSPRVYACDLDGDGDIDVLSASKDDKIAWYENLRSPGVGSPEIDVERDGTDDVHSHPFGTMQVGQSDSQVFILRNEGTVDLIISHAAGLTGPFSIRPANNINSTDDWIIPAGSTKIFTVSFNPIDAGVYSNTLVLTNNDPNEGSYQISLTGTATGSEIEVLGNHQVIYDGDTIPEPNDNTDFTNVDVISGSSVATFTIRNLGSEHLTLTGDPDRVVIIGSADFTVTRQPDSLIFPGGTSTFEITFDPSSYDIKTAIIRINTNDFNENPYEFTVQGTGSLFTNQQVISTQADGVNSVYAADLDGDGDKDILSSSWRDDKIAWYENLGGGVFGNQQVITLQADNAKSVYACDLDGDGDNDVLSVSYYGDSKLAWYENLGGGAFGGPQAIGGYLYYPRSVYACDMDGDGDNDVLLAVYEGIIWYENLGDGNFGPLQSGNTYGLDGGRSVYACDLDGDGDNDILSASYYDDKINWYDNPGDGIFNSEHTISTQANGATYVYACDLDSDGDYDVLSASENDNKIAWYENLGDGTFGTQQVISIQADEAKSVYACDLDGDGDNDVISASSDDNKIAWYENLGSGIFSSQRIITTHANYALSVYACDLDGDGNIDVLSASAGDDKIAWYENLKPPSPEMDVLGNGQIIVDGDMTANITDGTDFGSVNVADSSVTHTFTIVNNGLEGLILTGDPERIIIIGSPDFTVTIQPASLVTGGGQTLFEITFDPSSLGLKTATVTIANDDSNENPYDFMIQGVGIDTQSPTIDKLTPADDSIDVPVDTDLTIDFNEAIRAVSGNIEIRRMGDAGIVEVIPVSGDRVTITGTQAVIDPVSDLTEQTEYYVRIDSGVFEDLSGNSYVGIVNNTTWNFTTQIVNEPPVLDPIGVKSVDEGTELTFMVTASDPDIPANHLTFNLTNEPVGAFIDPDTGRFNWTPGEGQKGSYDVTFTVTDDGVPNLSDSETITITVNDDGNRINGSTWHDANQNGVWDVDEPGLIEWTVYLDLNDNSQLDEGEPFTTTDSNGYYSFINLTPGSYSVREVVPDQWEQIYPVDNDAHAIQVDPEDVLEDVNFGNIALVLFNDPNLKVAVEEVLGIVDPTEFEILALQTLFTGHRDISDLTGLEYARNLEYLVLWGNHITDIDPLLDLSNLKQLILTNNEISEFEAPSAWNNLTGLSLSNNRMSALPSLAGLNHIRTLDLSGNQISDISALTTLTSLTYLDLRNNPLNNQAYLSDIMQIQQMNPGIELLYDPQPSGEIRGFVWNDVDGDGFRDQDEVGLENQTVTLDCDEDNSFETITTQTDAEGYYVFTNLLPGFYTVHQNPANDWELTYPLPDGEYTVTLGPDEMIDGIDFGNAHNEAPVIDALIVQPYRVVQGNDLTLIAQGVMDDRVVVSVSFYRDDNDNGIGESVELLGVDTQGSDGWSWTGIANWEPGNIRYLVQATDDGIPLSSKTSEWVGAAGTVNEPLSILTETPLPQATFDIPYSTSILASGGIEPYAWMFETAGDDIYLETDVEPGYVAVGTPMDWCADDDCYEFTLPWSFTFYGTEYDSVWVCTNGYLDFASSKSDYSNSQAELINNVRIAPLWDDLVTDEGGDIYIDTTNPEAVTIRWAGQTYENGDPVDFMVTLNRNGSIRFGYRAEHSGLTPTIGISAGDGLHYTFSNRDDVGEIPTNVASLFAVAGNPLPEGLSLNEETGEISGIPMELGTFEFTIVATDSDNPANTMRKNFTLEVKALPDLLSTHFDVLADQVGWGESFEVNYTVLNQGSAGTGEFSFDVGFYLSEDTDYDAEEDVFLSAFSISELAAGADTSGTVTATLPSSSPFSAQDGIFYVVMFCDDTEQIPETNETNNHGMGSLVDYDELNVFVITTSSLLPLDSLD